MYFSSLSSSSLYTIEEEAGCLFEENLRASENHDGEKNNNYTHK